MTAAHCRIGRVTLKAGGLSIVRLKDGAERTRASILAEVRDVIDDMTEHGFAPTGFALVVWDGSASSYAKVKAYPGSLLPGIVVSDFVRNRLLAEKIMDWMTE